MSFAYSLTLYCNITLSQQDVQEIREKSEYQPAKEDDEEMAVNSDDDMEVTCQLSDNDTLKEVRVPKPSTLLFPY